MMAATKTEPIDGWRAGNGVIGQRHLFTMRLPIWQAILIVLVASSATTTVHTAFGFQLPHEPSKPWGKNRRCVNTGPKPTSSKLNMVRNIDLPDALVFYGVESMMTRQIDKSIGEVFDADDRISCVLRPGVARLLIECQEVGTAALLLSEELGEEESVKRVFQNAWGKSSDIGGEKMLETLMKSDDPVINFRCLNSEFATSVSNVNDDTSDNDLSDEYDESIEFYNLRTNGRSPSPAFLLDSLGSVQIDPRGFGGSSGFGRGQWIEPRRSPMPARTVVFIAGDWDTSKDQSMDEGEKSTVKDRCAAARAAGCRIVYLEQLPEQTQQNIPVQDDTQTMDLCDAVVSRLGNDNPRDLQPITLDAVSTPGSYWLNPPSPRDDVGNSVAVDAIVDWFRSEREMEEIVGDEGCVVSVDEMEDEMSEEEMNKILADLDGL
mmetsp:Transcript_30811/g.53544  ORF Transcript_30811/g.53544 Transcript_30811/m.53544 type:complete len:434 (-) Transcript_30811:334-1635(-)